jgi:phospholipase C
MNARVLSCGLAAAAVSAAALALVGSSGAAGGPQKLREIEHIVVIYQENHSFDNLYGGWEGVDGIADAPAARTTQVSQAGTPFQCLLQNDVNLTTPPLSATCTDSTTATTFTSHFGNAPFGIDAFIPATATTCPQPGVFAPNGVLNGTGLPGGCTRDLVHRFYQEQYQLNGGRQNRYVTGSDAVGLTMGVYDTARLPVYRYLHSPGHPRYAILDNFFQAAFGGSYLNHQWLVAAATPLWVGAPQSGPDELHSVVDANGMPNTYPLYAPIGPVRDANLTVKCPAAPGVACGDYTVNTTQPFYQPYAPGTAVTRRLPPLTTPTIGDRLSAAGVDWAWYSGGWSNADGRIGEPGWTNGVGPTCTDPNTIAGAVFPNCADKLFQFHHQALNYYASLAPGTAARQQHLRDEVEFEQLAKGTRSGCDLKPVSLVKPIGAENEHPGYASEPNGSDHLVELLKAIDGGHCRKATMVIVTYDEFGGQWDHVPPPGQGGAPGPHDQWGPGTRLPALVIAPGLRGQFVVDGVQHDTTSILATIEHRFGLAPLGPRDAAVNDLASVFSAKKPR